MNRIAAASQHPRSSELESVQQKLSRALQTIEVAARTSNDILYEWNIHGESSWRGGLGAILGLHDRVPVTYDFWKSLLHVEDEARVLASLEGALRGRSDRWSCTYRMRRADGSYATVLDRAHIFRDDSGGAQRLVGWLIDLSAQISLGEQLVEAERRYHALFAQSIDAMVFTAADGTFIDANPAFGPASSSPSSRRSRLDTGPALGSPPSMASSNRLAGGSKWTARPGREARSGYSSPRARAKWSAPPSIASPPSRWAGQKRCSSWTTRRPCGSRSAERCGDWATR